MNGERLLKLSGATKYFVRDSDKCDNLEIIDPYVQCMSGLYLVNSNNVSYRYEECLIAYTFLRLFTGEFLYINILMVLLGNKFDKLYRIT